MIIAIIFLVILCGILGFCLHKEVSKDKAIKAINIKIDAENKELEDKHTQLNKDIDKAEQEKNELLAFLDSLHSSIQKAQENETLLVKQKAETEYKNKTLELQRDFRNHQDKLTKEYKEKEIALNNAITKLIQKRDSQELIVNAEIEKILQAKEEVEGKLNALKEKYSAYLKQQQRDKEIEEKQDYFRLNLAATATSDIAQLRTIQHSFVKKDVIDKVIWEAYYKEVFDVLVSHTMPNKDKVCGIYKITSLQTNQVYIGQSVDIKTRWKQHIRSAIAYSPSNNKLYQAMHQELPEHFTFEILEEVAGNLLDEREKFWIDFYQSKEFGLNNTKGNS